jgi:hypothetical protein
MAPKKAASLRQRHTIHSIFEILEILSAGVEYFAVLQKTVSVCK